jgi:uncharacterized membrane protein
MSGKRITIIQWTSLFAGSIIALQIGYIFLKGEVFCLNDGCRIVENLTTISPLYINFTGLFYFTLLFCTSLWLQSGPGTFSAWTRLLLLLGLAVEGVLVSYQIFVIQNFCSYCLFVLCIIVILNILYGWQQIGLALALFGVTVASFAVLNFSPASLLALRNETLASGTFAVKKCAVPAKKLYFFFSSDCPHCQNVLSVLENCNSCEFHFNPIDKNNTLAMPELEYSSSYSPSLNRVVLSMLNITTIPVLLVQNQDGLSFIKGEESITRFVSRTCFHEKEEISIESSLYEFPAGMNINIEEEAECAIEVECPDESEAAQNSSAQ